jgi:hypothetical protein
MRSTNMDELALLIAAANDWHAAGLTVNVLINQINSTMPDGTSIVLSWSDEFGEWLINT